MEEMIEIGIETGTEIENEIETEKEEEKRGEEMMTEGGMMIEEAVIEEEMIEDIDKPKIYKLVFINFFIIYCSLFY